MTFYAIAISINKIVEVILNNQNSVLTVSSYIESMFDNQISNVYLSLPVVVNSKGVKNIITLNYSDEEIKQIVKSANILRANMKSLKNSYKTLNRGRKTSILSFKLHPSSL